MCTRVISFVLNYLKAQVLVEAMFTLLVTMGPVMQAVVLNRGTSGDYGSGNAGRCSEQRNNFSKVQ